MICWTKRVGTDVTDECPELLEKKLNIRRSNTCIKVGMTKHY